MNNQIWQISVWLKSALLFWLWRKTVSSSGLF